MRYNLESTLPIEAFSPRGGRNNPFARGMTLEGGGGGGGFVGKALGSVAKAVTGAVKGVVQPVYNATLKNIPGVDKALTGLDKSVSSAIPGGWGTIASVASSFIPGAQLAALGMTQTGLATGLGALTGSGVLRKGNQFNMQGALMGGAAAYGLSSLGEYAKAASNAPTPTVDTSGALSAGTSGSALTGTSSGYVPSDFLKGTSIGADALSGSSSLTPTANALANSEFVAPSLSGSVGNMSVPSELGSLNPYTSSGIQASLPAAGSGSTGAGLGGFTQPPSMLDKIGTSIANAPSNIAESASNFLDKATTGSTYSDLASGAGDTLKGMGSNIADTGAGIKNLITGVPGATAAAAASGVSPSLAGAAALYGTAGLSALEEQKNYLNQQLASDNIAQSEYNAQVAEIDRQIVIARQAMADNPWNVNPDRSAVMGETAYARAGEQQNLYDRSPSNLYFNEPSAPGSTFTAAKGGRVPYAVGGSVDDNSGMDEARGLYQGNLQNGFMGGGMPSYAKGGEARERRNFLDMIEASVKTPPAQYVEGMGFVTPPPSVEGRLGANFDALGGNIRAGASGMAMMSPDKRIMTNPGMMDIGYRSQVGPGELDVGLQRAIRGVPGRGKDYAVTANYSMPFAKGGEARFLSGGGDGMSDSIPASINGRQEARLADGEFVIPADVVSHLGNGSSKAGAKRLYSMMDKVRKARTGTAKQGKQINPNKFMPA